VRRYVPLALLATCLATPVVTAARAAADPAEATVTSFLGGGVVDGGPATSAALYASSAAYAPDGTLYIADRLHNRVRSVSTSGTISTVAGTGDQLLDGTGGFAGDGGPAVAAALSNPTEIAVEANGDVLVLDAGNKRVRRIDHATGVIATIAGNGTSGATAAAGDATTGPLNADDIAIDPVTGDVAIADRSDSRIWALHANGSLTVLAGGGPTYPGDGGAPTDARVGPSTLAYTASGGLLFADYDRVRQISGGIVTTVFGGGSNQSDGVPATEAKGMLNATNLAVLPDGTVWVGSWGASTLRTFTVGGTVSTVAAPCASASTVSPQGRLVLACTSVLLQQPDGSFVSVAGNRTQWDNSDSTPDGTTAANAAVQPTGGLLNRVDGVVVTNPHSVDRLDAAGVLHRIAGVDGTAPEGPVGGQAAATALSRPTDVAAAPEGGLFVLDNGKVKLVTADGVLHSYAASAPVWSAITEGQPAAQLPFVQGMASLPNGDLYVGALGRIVRISWADQTVHVVTPQLHDMGGTTLVGLTVEEGAIALAVDTDGSLMVLSSESQGGSFLNSRVRRVDPTTGAWSMMYAGKQLSALNVVDGTAYVALAGTRNALVQRLDDDGAVTTLAGGGHQLVATQTGNNLFMTTVTGIGAAPGGGLLIASDEGRRVLRLGLGNAAPPVPGLTNVVTTPGGTGTVTVSWQAPVGAPAGSVIEYAQREGHDTGLVGRSGYGSLAIDRTSLVMSYLIPGRQYTMSMYVVAPGGNVSAPVTVTFVAPGDTTPPGNTEPNYLLSRDSTATFVFAMPENLDFKQSEVRFALGTALPSTSLAPSWTGRSNSTTGRTGTAVLTGLAVGQTYSASLTSVDYTGNTTVMGPFTFVAGSAPQMSLLQGPAEGAWTGPNVTVYPWSANNAGSGYPECSLDGSPKACDYLPLPLSGLTAGTHVFTVKGVTPLGDGPTFTRTWRVDTANPTVSVGALPPFTLGSAVAVPLGGSDAGSGIGSWNVRYQKAASSGAFGGWVSTRATTTRINVPLTVGYTTCVQAQAVDRTGKLSAWSASRCTTRPLDDRALAASAGWTRPAASGYYLNTFTTTKTLRSSLSRTVTFRQLALVATRCPTCGSVSIYSGTTLLRTINLAASTTIRQSLFLLPVVSTRTAAVSIRVTSSGKLIQIDGLGVARA